MPVLLGPFELLEHLATGGMGEVWRGTHRQSGVQVAVKVLTDAAAREERYYAQFRREVQAAASLAHAHVIPLYDYGTIDAPSAAASMGALQADTPYLAMEYAAHGSLDDAAPIESFAELRRLLFALLDALGHAHARGLVHRDLKPGNVLLTSTSGAEGIKVPKLSDFGLAQGSPLQDERGSSVENSALTEAPAGTPLYMAPEQIYGRFRDYGPWTDLYALGLLAWELTCARTPFQSATMVGMLYQQLEEPLPALEPRFDVPPAFEAWLTRLTHKRARDRYQCAADASWVLSQMGDAAHKSRAPDSASSAPAPNLALSLTLPAMPALRTENVSAKQSRPRLEIAIDAEGAAPPHPASWRGNAPIDLSSNALSGAGLGLFFLRENPIVGRGPERDLLWEELSRVRLEQRARAVVLSGSAGIGKSRLARWLCERAHEAGAASVLATTFTETPAPRTGLPQLLIEHCRAAGLKHEALLARVIESLSAQDVDDEWEARAIAALAGAQRISRTSQDVPEGTRAFSPATPEERYEVYARVLARCSRERPALVWLDDVQWGVEGLALVQHLLGRELPVLFVLVARDDLLRERAAESALLSRIEERPDVRRCVLRPLDQADTRTLVRHLLPLDEGAVSSAASRSAGNPLFALQIVGDWITRGKIVAQDSGFEAWDDDLTVPNDLHAVWHARVSLALGARGAELLPLVELAAVLGLSVDAEEFGRACNAAQTSFPSDLLEPLILGRLVLPNESGWTFAHGLLRESLLRGAREVGRLEAHHACCVRALEEGDVSGERLATHLLGAGRAHEALAPLRLAAQVHTASSDFERALAALTQHDEVVSTLRASPREGVDEAVARAELEAMALRADAHRLRWDMAAAEVVATALLEKATRLRDDAARANATMTLAHTARHHGDRELASSRARQALGLFDRAGHDVGRARCLVALAILARQSGEHERAVELYQRARELFALLGDKAGLASCLLGLGHVARRKDPSEARTLYERARSLFEQAGSRASVGHCVNGLAEVARYEGDLEAAEAGYREALELQLGVGAKSAIIPRLNLGLVQSARAHFEDARATLEAALPTLVDEGQRGLLGCAHACLLPSYADAGMASAFDEHASAARALLDATGTIEADVASAAELAGRLWRTRGDAERARVAFTLALAQWTALGHEARVRALALFLGE